MNYFIFVILIIKFVKYNFIIFSFFTINSYVLYVKFIIHGFSSYVIVNFRSLCLFIASVFNEYLYLFLFVIIDFFVKCQYVFDNFFLWIIFIFICLPEIHLCCYLLLLEELFQYLCYILQKLF